MLHNTEYEYENELSIDSKLICSICLNPFNKPKITLCKHIFCDYCIQLWFKRSLSCPMCRELLLKKHLKSVKNPNVLNKLDQLHVKCLLCQQTKIKRKDFDYHIDNQCPKVIVSCSTNHLKCSWKGQRADLQSHQMICSNQSNRKIFNHQVKAQKIKLNLIL